MILSILFAVLGLVMIFFGARILFTGKLGKGEEAKIANYSNKGAKVYKLMNVLLYFVVGLFLIGECILDVLQMQKVIEDNFPIKIVLFAIILVMVVVYFVVASKCKNMTDDE